MSTVDIDIEFRSEVIARIGVPLASRNVKFIGTTTTKAYGAHVVVWILVLVLASVLGGIPVVIGKISGEATLAQSLPQRGEQVLLDPFRLEFVSMSTLNESNRLEGAEARYEQPVGVHGRYRDRIMIPARETTRGKGRPSW